MPLQQRHLPFNEQYLPMREQTLLQKKQRLLAKGQFFTTCILGLAFCFFVLFVSPAFAHKVYIYAWQQGEQICTESYFSASNTIKNAPVTMQNTKGDILQSATTDSKGMHCFTMPLAIEDLTFTIDAGQGHKSSFVLPASSQMNIPLTTKEKTPEQAPAKTSQQAPQKNSQQASTQAPTQAPEQAFQQVLDQSSVQTSVQASEQTSTVPFQKTAAVQDISAETAQILRTVIQEEIRKELAPLYQQLARQDIEASPKVRDIISGLGWIAGLTALAYAYKRRKKE